MYIHEEGQVIGTDQIKQGCRGNEVFYGQLFITSGLIRISSQSIVKATSRQVIINMFLNLDLSTMIKT